uniref:Growth differentiation factor 7 n=1 Tax=Bos mutus grunniens TaxID=30521 RepID=A0A8C0AGJ3_BOSMU
MDLSAAAALCLWLLSACRPRDGLEAAAVLRAAGAGPAESPGGGGGGSGTTLAAAEGTSAALAAASPGPRGARRATGSGFRNGSVVPHQFMMSLYRSLAGRTPAGPVAVSTSGSGRHGRADTVTGFADQAIPDESAAQTGLNFLFDVSSLPDADEVLGAELRVLRRESGARGPGSASPPLLLLSTCPSAASAPRLLHSRAAEFLDAARWEVFDVADALRRHRREPRTSRAFCLSLSGVVGSARVPLALRPLGFGLRGGGGAAAEERALLVVSSRTQRKESLFREIRSQARALGAALAVESRPDSRPGVGSPTAVIGGRRRRRTALAGAGSSGQGRSRCSRKPLHVDFKGWAGAAGSSPLDYEAYHCGRVRLPLRSHLEPTNHAIIHPISILYIDAANNVVYKQYEDMVVEACGCR